jgi:hypothetical protein
VKRDVLKQLLARYRFGAELSPETRRHGQQRKKEQLKAILRIRKTYTFFTGIIISVLFLIRKGGFPVTFMQATIATVLLTGGIILVLAGGSIAVYSAISTPRTGVERPIEMNPAPVQEEISPAADAVPAPKTPKEEINYTIALLPIEADREDRETAKELRNSIRATILTDLGHSGAYLASGNNLKHTPYILKSSLAAIGANRILSVKLVDTETSAIVHMASARYTGPGTETALVREVLAKIPAAKRR